MPRLSASGCTLAIALVATVSGGFGHSAGLSGPAAWTLAVTVFCALSWMSECLPLPVTALVPLAVFPLVGVLSPDAVAQAYGNPIILLFLGGFLLSRAMESSGAHRRIALQMMQLFGGSGRRMVFGFMLAAALLSMWVSNTATALMLLPVALAIANESRGGPLALALLLAVAYGCSIGGLGTPIGSPPNLVFLQVYEQSTGESLSFLQWMGYGLPVVIIMLPLAALWLSRHVPAVAVVALPAVGPLTVAERRVLLIFGATALAWMTRAEPWGGWSAWLNLPGANDASVALLGALLMFVLPDGRGQRLLSWEQAERIPWGMLILFGGGITIAAAFAQSGLSEVVGAQFTELARLPLLLMIVTVAGVVIFLTEINSNTATAVLLLPVLAAAALALQIDPLLLMLPAALAASCAFMLPVATPPNAIVFGSGMVPIRVMVREGLALNVLGLVVISAWVYLRLG
ncbi:MAG: DASS family sodium-coupled anion symporter [Oceanococcaceae bacterium]